MRSEEAELAHSSSFRAERHTVLPRCAPCIGSWVSAALVPPSRFQFDERRVGSSVTRSPSNPRLVQALVRVDEGPSSLLQQWMIWA